MKNLLPILILLVGVVAFAGPDKTTRGRLTPVQNTAQAEVDSIPQFVVLPGDSLHIQASGYDKTLRSARESFFLTNSDTLTIEMLWLTITYMDMEGRMLHRRSLSVEADVPTGETRQLSFPTWDTQRLFYYHLTGSPSQRATPYKITLSIDSALVR